MCLHINYYTFIYRPEKYNKTEYTSCACGRTLPAGRGSGGGRGVRTHALVAHWCGQVGAPSFSSLVLVSPPSLQTGMGSPQCSEGPAQRCLFGEAKLGASLRAPFSFSDRSLHLRPLRSGLRYHPLPDPIPPYPTPAQTPKSPRQHAARCALRQPCLGPLSGLLPRVPSTGASRFGVLFWEGEDFIAGLYLL